MVWLEKISKYLLWLSIIVLPWQLRHTFLFTSHNGEFFEYSSLSFYLSDIVIIGLLVFWLIEIIKTQPKFIGGPRWITYPLLVWLGWLWLTLISANMSTGNWAVTLLAAGHVTLFFGFYLYLVNHVKDIKELLWPLAAGIFLQSILAIGQYKLNRSLGWRWLGESVLRPLELGIPVVLQEGERQLRAHGTLPHANVLGGILTYAIAVLLPGWAFIKTSWQRLIIWGIITLGLVALVLSFSRSAWLAAGLVGAVLICGGLLSKKFLFKVKWQPILLTTIIILGLVAYQWPAVISRFDLSQNSIERESIASRVEQWQQFKSVFAWAPGWGLGLGQYAVKLEQDDVKAFGWNYDAKETGWKYSLSHQVWDYQPVHNIYLLALAETGVVGGLIWLWLLVGVLITGWQSAWRTKNWLGWGVWLGYIALLIVGMFDHYLWTLQQGRLILFLSISMIAIYSINQNLYDGRRSN